MTAPQADGADRVSSVAKSPLSASAAFSGLAVLLLVGLLLRLTIAYVLLPGSGFESDIGTFTAWALNLAQNGSGPFYATASFADYPPGYLYVLWLIGGLGHVLAPFAHGDPGAATSALIKLPAIFADIAVGYVLYRIVRSWRAPRPDAHRLAMLAAAIYLFNPVTWYDSAVWGQTDSVGALLVLLTVAALVRGNSEGASALAVLAALVKPQFGIVLLPIVGVILLRRHLLAYEGPRNPVLLPVRLRSWFESEHGYWRIVSSALVSLVVLLVLITPFSLDIFGFIRQMVGTASGYPFLSVNAYNPWALIGSEGRAPLAFGGGWSSDTAPLLGPVPGVGIGGLLLAVGFALGAARAAWRDNRTTIVVVTTFLALAFFMLPTRVHERYMFPIFALLPLLAVVDRRWAWATVALSIAAFINFHGILTTDLYATPNLENLPLGELFRQPIGVLASVALFLVGSAFVVWRMLPSVAEEPDPYERPYVPPRSRRSLAAGATELAGAGAAMSLAALPDAGAAELELAELGPEPFFAGARRWVGNFIQSGSVRRDRSALLVGETGGRLDRRDLLMVGLVFASTLLLRSYRLEVPYSMHFDEVYHARTAMEFLQDWRYGMPHSIYEYTHPHLAKYAMALGIEALGNNRVTDVSDLGTSVKSAAIEERWSPATDTNGRNGDRLYVVTASEVRVYDLANRAQVATIAGAYGSIAVDPGTHTLYLGEAGGQVWQVDTGELDDARASGTGAVSVVPRAFANFTGLSGTLDGLAVASEKLVAVSASGSVVGIDLTNGLETGRATLDTPTDVAGINVRHRVMVDPSVVTNSADLAGRISGLIEGSAGLIQGRINAATAPVPVAGFLNGDAVTKVQDEIDAGNLPGVTIEDGSGLAVGTASGVVLLDTAGLVQLTSFPTDAPVTGLTLVEQGVEQPTVYAAAGSQLVTVRIPNDDKKTVGLGDRVTMPNHVEKVYWNRATTMIHVLGRTQDGLAPTVYVVEPRATPSSVFADAQLASEPQVIVLDVQSERPAEDRDDLLAIDSAGQLSTVDIGNNQFAYRFPGVLVGSLMAVCIYLLARFLFRRRSVALICSLLVLADGMFFANARIAMNDTYVAFFIVAAMTVFVPLWLGRWRSGWATAGGLVAVGLLLGLALASKWVGAYAIGGVGLLILLRSSLGRLIGLAAMIALTGVLGYIAITPNPSVASPQINYPFLALMIGLTTLLAVAITLRPVRLTKDELRLAILAPIVPGFLLLAYGTYRLITGAPAAVDATLTPTRLIAFGLGLVVIGLAVLGVSWWAGRRGHGPFANAATVDPNQEPAEPPPPRGWLRPGSGFLGLPWLLALGSIIVIPLAVYLASYIPWIELGNRWTADFPTGHTGQLFLDLQTSMYDYHNFLRATHPASSPWWAWPLDLKPVWFEQNDYAGSTTAVIYDTGNLVIFWLSIPAVAWAAWQAWRRRSLALTFVVIAIAAMWLPWARIDRATFQYHIFTTLPFSFMALAYFLAEMWHGPSRRTWTLARVAAAIAIIGAPLLWLLRLPLCGIARTEQVNAGTEVCGSLSRDLVLTDLQTLGLALAVGGLVAAGALFFSGKRSVNGLSNRVALLLPVSFAVALFGVAVVVIGAGLAGPHVLQWKVTAEEPAAAALLLLAVPAYFVLRATDPKRFVVGALAAVVVWFVAFYPNIGSLPVPTALSQIHLGLLPTWNWGFQFGVNLDEGNRAGLDMLSVGLLSLAVSVLCVAAAYAARGWRIDRAAESESTTVSALTEAG